MNKLELEWEVKHTYRDTIDVEDIADFIIDNDYCVIENGIVGYYDEYGCFDFNHLPKDIQNKITKAVQEEVEERKNKKITIEHIDNQILKMEQAMYYYYGSINKTTSLFDEKEKTKEELINMIEKYKNQD